MKFQLMLLAAVCMTIAGLLAGPDALAQGRPIPPAGDNTGEPTRSHDDLEKGDDCVKEASRSILLDTDIGPDCDDTAALALAVLYAQKTNVHLLGVMHCTSSPWGVGAIRSVLNWYGHGETPVGTLKDSGLLDSPDLARYNRALALLVDESAREADDAQLLYRELLQAQPDQSVEIIAIGPLRNLGNLLASADGVTLLSRKVRRLVLMAGNFELHTDSAEWNILMDIPSAQRVAQLWPGEIIYCGWEVGAPVVALKEPSPLNEGNPVRISYQLHSQGEGRSSWDLCTVQWALDPSCGFYRLSEPGTIQIDDRGVTRWQASPEGRHFYVSLSADPQRVADCFEQTLAAFDADRNTL